METIQLWAIFAVEFVATLVIAVGLKVICEMLRDILQELRRDAKT